MNGPDRSQASSLTRATLAEPWNRLTAIGLAAGAAAAHPQRIFLSDCPDREAWEGSPPRSLTFAEFRRQVEFFASQIETLGLSPGDRALILMPNIVEASIAIMGCLAASVTPALAPVEENLDTLRIAAERVGATAIFTTARCEEIRPAELARQIAARVISIRCVAGFGSGLPDGVIPLDGWAEQDVDPNPNRPPRQQDQEALITFSSGSAGLMAHIRSEAQLIADALAIATRHKLARESVLTSSMHPAGAVMPAAALLVPLFLGAGVQLLGPFKAERLRRALASAGEGGSLLCPASFLPLLDEARPREPALAALSTVLAVMRPGQAISTTREGPPVSVLFDLFEQGLLALGEIPAGPEDLIGAHQHPMEGVLAEGQPYLTLARDDHDQIQALGFAAAENLVRSDTSAAA